MTEDERENLLRRFAQPLSATEDQRAENACRVMTKAVKQAPALAERNINVFIQGSYRNGTNVRLESDVDICVCLSDTISTDYEYAPNLSDVSMGHTSATYTYSEFKNDLGEALRSAFGAVNVTRGNKAFNIKENTYRVTADVVACLEHRRYHANGVAICGTALFPDDGGARIENYPEQHYGNGVAKHNATGGDFKAAVRMMKNLRNQMVEHGSKEAERIPSFLNECLVWNTPDHLLMLPSRNQTMREILIFLWQQLESDTLCSTWGQVSELLYLFREPFKREDARAWVNAAWGWLEYE